MKAKYTKRQIMESIKHWKKVLESIDEKESSKDLSKASIDALMKMASQIVPDKAKLAKQLLSEQELNEGIGSGVLMGIMGTLLALSMMGKISLNMKNAIDSSISSRDDVKIVQKCDKSIQQIASALNEIEDNISAIRNTHNLDNDDPSVEELAKTVAEEMDATQKAAEREAIFNKIMANDNI